MLDLTSLVQEKLDTFSADETVKELLGEWWTVCDARLMPREINLSMHVGQNGRPIFVVSCNNGYHESYEGFAEALESLVDSHRTRWEDLESTHTALSQVLGVSVREARRICCREPERARETLGRA